MKKRTKYEKETILVTSEGDSTMSIYTFNAGLKRRLADFARKYPTLAHLDESTPEGSVTYTVDKSRVSIRLIPPYSEERKLKARLYARKNGLKSVAGGLQRTA